MSTTTIQRSSKIHKKCIKKDYTLWLPQSCFNIIIKFCFQLIGEDWFSMQTVNKTWQKFLNHETILHNLHVHICCYNFNNNLAYNFDLVKLPYKLLPKIRGVLLSAKSLDFVYNIKITKTILSNLSKLTYLRVEHLTSFYHFLINVEPKLLSTVVTYIDCDFNPSMFTHFKHILSSLTNIHSLTIIPSCTSINITQHHCVYITSLIEIGKHWASQLSSFTFGDNYYVGRHIHFSNDSLLPKLTVPDLESLQDMKLKLPSWLLLEELVVTLNLFNVCLLAYIPAPNLKKLTLRHFLFHRDLLCMLLYYPKLEHMKILYMELWNFDLFIECISSMFYFTPKYQPITPKDDDQTRNFPCLETLEVHFHYSNNWCLMKLIQILKHHFNVIYDITVLKDQTITDNDNIIILTLNLLKNQKFDFEIFKSEWLDEIYKQGQVMKQITKQLEIV